MAGSAACQFCCMAVWDANQSYYTEKINLFISGKSPSTFGLYMECDVYREETFSASSAANVVGGK